MYLEFNYFFKFFKIKKETLNSNNNKLIECPVPIRDN